MSRQIHKHPVELLVEAYLKRFAKTSNTRGKVQIMEKAAKLIGIALHDPCCPPAEAVTLGRTEDFFITQIISLTNGIDERKWKASLTRAKEKLDNTVANPCCED